MHEIDLTLVEDAKKQIATAKTKRLEALIWALEKYQSACQLSHGPDIHRSKYWSMVAKENWAKLHNITYNRAAKKAERECYGI